MPMRRTDQPRIRDSRSRAVGASCWTLQTPEHRTAAADAALAAMPASPGLLRFSAYCGIEDLTLFLLSQWTDEAARDEYISVSDKPRAVTDAMVSDIRRDWRHPAQPYRSFISQNGAEVGCLVVVRQPLEHPGGLIGRDWADTVIAALESDGDPLPGLCAATFFVVADHSHVLNLAEWTSADAHRAALQNGTIGQHGSLGTSTEWAAARSHPGITAEHDVRRYRFFGAVEPQPVPG